MRRLVIRSGGQTGVDRAALEAAARLGLSYRGWCPKGGWAEDLAAPPGIRRIYPELKDTPSADPHQRTAWNVRDADATLILTSGTSMEVSRGSGFTRLCAEVIFETPWRMDDIDRLAPRDEIVGWISDLLRRGGTAPFDFNVAGPRESEVPGIQGRATEYLLHLLRDVG